MSCKFIRLPGFFNLRIEMEKNVCVKMGWSEKVLTSAMVCQLCFHHPIMALIHFDLKRKMEKNNPPGCVCRRIKFLLLCYTFVLFSKRRTNYDEKDSSKKKKKA